jgi:hypothetical protein
MEDLRSALKLLRKKVADGRHYIPDIALQRVMTTEAIQNALEDTSIQDQYIEQTAAHIFSSGIKIFAILVLTQQADCVLKLIECELLQDGKLPFDEQFEGKSILSKADKFFKKQWEVKAPHFQYGTFNIILKPMARLPFIVNRRLEEVGKRWKLRYHF